MCSSARESSFLHNRKGHVLQLSSSCRRPTRKRCGGLAERSLALSVINGHVLDNVFSGSGANIFFADLSHCNFQIRVVPRQNIDVIAFVQAF